MAVKCNIPNLALISFHSILYGFSCEDATTKIAQNYLEYLQCVGVDYSFCEDYPCIQPGGDVFCFIDDVDLALVSVNITAASINFTPPSQPYTVNLIKIDGNVTVTTAINPTAPIQYTNLLVGTAYKVVLILMCEGGETKTVELPFSTLPTCVEIDDYTGVATDVNEYA